MLSRWSKVHNPAHSIGGILVVRDTNVVEVALHPLVIFLLENVLALVSSLIFKHLVQLNGFLYLSLLHIHLLSLIVVHSFENFTLEVPVLLFQDFPLHFLFNVVVQRVQSQVNLTSLVVLIFLNLSLGILGVFRSLTLVHL